MKRVVPSVVWTCTLLMLLCLTIRLVWTASRLETGLPTLATDWRNSALAWAIGSYVPVPERTPEQQAEFWLAETDRILREHSDDPRLTMAAALVLDSPATHFMRSHLKAIRVTNVGTFPEMDWKAVQLAEDEFETRCKDRCLELAAKATELEPENIDWRQLRAILLVRRGATSPRDLRWLRMLDDFQLHDPKNALYDYLAASLLWRQSTKWVPGEHTLKLEILDEEACQEGVYRFNRAQSKPFLALADVGFTITADLLKFASIAPKERPSIINSREIHSRLSFLVLDLWRWQFERADEELRHSNVEAAIVLRRGSLHLIAQVAAVGRSTENDSALSKLKVATTEWLKKTAENHRDAIPSLNFEEILAAHKQAQIEQMVLQRAAQALPQNQPRPKRDPSFFGAGTSLLDIVRALAPQLTVVLYFLGLVFTVVLRVLPAHSTVVGPIGQFMAFVLAAAASIAIFGLAPAEIIPRGGQKWTGTILILSIPIGLVCWLGWHALRRRRYQFSLRALFIVSFILSLMCAAAAPVLEKLPFSLSIPPYTRGEVDAESLGQWFTAQGAQAWWIVDQWVVYHGHLWTIAMWAVLVAVLYHWKLCKLTRRGTLPATALALKNGIPGFVASINQPAFAMSALLLMIYLLTEPRAIIESDRRYQQEMSFARDPDSYWKMVAHAVNSVRANKEVMAEIHKAVESDQ